MYMVYKVVSTSAWNAMLDWGTSPAGFGDWPYSDGNIYPNFGGPQHNCGTPTASLTSYRIISLIAATNNYSLWVDGGTGGSSGGTAPLFNTTSNTVGWTTTAPNLGASTSLSAALDGWIAEIYFTNSVQTVGDRQLNEGYLAWKWGLQGNLDPSHPYKSAAPQVNVSMVKIGDVVGGGTSGSILYLGPGSALAQDNANFFWDDVQHSLNLSGTPALYKVPNASGDNWFEGGSGNYTVTGYNNFGTGQGSLISLTTGHSNTALGANALKLCDVGIGSTALGGHALENASGSGCSLNFAVGGGSLQNLTSGSDNIAMGENSGTSLNSGSANVFLGGGINFITGSYNIYVGNQTAQNLISGSQNILIGFGSGYYLTGGSNNVMIGPWPGGTGSVSYSNIIGFSATADLSMDYNYITPNIWSIQRATSASGFHIYNTWDGNASPTNYERAILDWNATSNIFRIGSQAGGTGTVRLIAIDGFQKAGAPAAGDLPSGTCALINDTSGGQTWFCYNAAGTIRKVQLT